MVALSSIAAGAPDPALIRWLYLPRYN